MCIGHVRAMRYLVHYRALLAFGSTESCSARHTVADAPIWEESTCVQEEQCPNPNPRTRQPLAPTGEGPALVLSISTFM